MSNPNRRFQSFAIFITLVFLSAAPVFAQGGTKPQGEGGTKIDNTSAQTGDEISQWASSASASSEYVGWEAVGATGAADVDGCGDLAGAWASEKWSEGVEWWLGYYDTPVIPSQISVHQNFNPGTIVNLVVFPVGSDEPIVLEDSADDSARDCPHIFTYQVSGIEVAIDRVGLFVDQRAIENWTEVDAVELIGVPSGESGGGDPTDPGGAGDNSIPENTTAAFGVGVTCPSGTIFENGMEVVVNMRSGFTYTATAIGVDGFDPIVAVTDGDTTLCDDDNSDVSAHIASLPSSGEVGPSNLSAQMVFTYSGDEAFKNISFVVGSTGSTEGSVVMTIEGLAVTSSDGIGDPFSLRLTENIIGSGVDISAYMISVNDGLDSQLYVTDSDNEIIVLEDGTVGACDDAGTPSCYGGQNDSLGGYYVTRSNGNPLGGGQYDSYMRFDASNNTPDTYVNFRFSSSQQRTLGDYVAVFHIGTTAAP